MGNGVQVLHNLFGISGNLAMLERGSKTSRRARGETLSYANQLAHAQGRRIPATVAVIAALDAAIQGTAVRSHSGRVKPNHR